MPKQIKLTDKVAEELAQRAKEDNLSLAGEVAKLLGSPQSDLSGRLEYLENYIDKRFNELKSLIEDTTVDRLAGPVRRRNPYEKRYIPWPKMQEIFYDFLEPNAPEWVSRAAENAIGELNNDLECYVADNQICVDDSYGHKQPLLNLSPRLLGELPCDIIEA